MAVLLNGSTQYITFGNAVDVLSTRPITLAALIDSASLRTVGSWNSIFSQGDYADRGWGVEIEADNSRVFSTYTNSLGNDENFSTWTVPPATGYWLIACVIRDTGANSATHFYGYRYNTRAFSFGTTGGGGASDAEPIAVGASDPTLIGAFNDAGAVDHFPGTISWVGVWNFDFSDGGNAGSKYFRNLALNGPWAFQGGLYRPRLFVPLTARYNLRDLSPYGRRATAAAGLTWAAPVLTEPKPRIFNVEWLVPQEQAGGGVTYDKTGTLTSPAALSGTDSNVFNNNAQDSTPSVISGVDSNVFTNEGAGVSPAVASGSDSNVFTETSATVAPAVLSGADSAIYNDSATATTPAVLSGADSNVFSNEGAGIGPAALSGVDANVFDRTGAITTPASIAGQDSNVYNDSGAFYTPAIISGTASAQAVYDKTGTVTTTAQISGTDANVFGETSATFAPGVISGVDNNAFADTASITAPASISGDVQVVYNESGATVTPAVITGQGQNQATYTKTGTLSLTAQLSGADSVVYIESGNTTATLTLSGVRAASAGGGASTQWVPIGYADVAYNQQLQKAAERDKLAARREREARDEKDLIDILLIL